MKKCLLFFVMLIGIAVSAQNVKEQNFLMENLPQSYLRAAQEAYNKKNPYAPQLLDSIVHRNTDGTLHSKQIFDYTKGYESMSASYSWDSSAKKWTGEGKTEYEYNESDSLTFYATYYWNAELDDWYCIYKTEHVFDENNRRTRSSSYSWNEAQNKLIGSFQSTYQYDANGNLILYSLYDWNTTINDWLCYTETKWTYENNLLKEELHHSWNKSTGELTTGWQYIFSYANGRIDTETQYSWRRSAGIWEISRIYNYIYNGGNLSEKIENVWLNVMERWTISDKYVYGYNSNGKLITEDNYKTQDEGITWKIYSSTQYDYDSNGHKTLDAYSTYDSGTGSWTTSHRYEYTYDNAGRNTLKIMYFWNSGVVNWSSSRTEQGYDENGNMTLYAHYGWDMDNLSWKGEIKDVRAYDSHTQLQSAYISYIWDAVKKDWVESSQSMYEFDQRGNYTASEYNLWDAVGNSWSVLYKSKTEYIYNTYGNPDTGTYNDWDGSKFVFDGTGKYYYNESGGIGGGSGIDGTQAENVQVYPNPASDYITVSLPAGMTNDAAIILSDMNGKICLKAKITAAQPLYIGNLASGIYFYQIRNGNNLYKGKLIIR